ARFLIWPQPCKRCTKGVTEFVVNAFNPPVFGLLEFRRDFRLTVFTESSSSEDDAGITGAGGSSREVLICFAFVLKSQVEDHCPRAGSTGAPDELCVVASPRGCRTESTEPLLSGIINGCDEDLRRLFGARKSIRRPKEVAGCSGVKC